jgi:hypothetical protein
MLAHRHHAGSLIDRAALAAKLGAASWGVFFIWLGIAFLAGLSFGIGLLGVGLITLGAQVARWAFHLPMEGFWVVVGILFLAGGLWALLAIGLPFVPILLLVAGVAILLGGFAKKRGSSPDSA